MRATAIRYKSTKEIPVSTVLENLCEYIVHKASAAGFITESQVLTKTSIKVGMHMSSFRVNTAMLGHNARLGIAAYGYNGCKSPKGYKRTNVPTWDQRVEFNNIVNDAFDKYKLTARIVSGNYTVRTKEGRINSWYEGGDRGNGWSGDASVEIISELEARERLDSDRLEKEHAEKTKVTRLAKAKQRREVVKLYENAKRVVVAGFWSYSGKPTKNGKKLTHGAFEKMLAKLDQWQARKVRSASIIETAKAELVGF